MTRIHRSGSRGSAAGEPRALGVHREVHNESMEGGDRGLVRRIGTRALTANAFNMTVGAGIFALPGVVARGLGAAAPVAYVVCAGAMALIVLCFAEAGSRVSRTGGTYAYAGAVFGPYIGFLIGALLWFGAGALATAGVANILVASLGQLVPALGQGVPRAIVILAAYGLLATMNIRGVHVGSRLIEGLSVAKLLPLLVLVAVGLFAINPAFVSMPVIPGMDQVGRTSLLLIFAFLGFESALTPSGEVRDAHRTVPRAVLLALAVVTVLYLAIQFVAQGVLGPALVDHADAPLAATAQQLLGAAGRVLIAVGATISTLGYMSGDMLSSPRALFAFAHDGIMPSPLARVHARYRTPYIAIITHAIIVAALAIVGSFGKLALVANVSILLMYITCCLAILPMRSRNVRAEGPPFVLPGGPTVPLLASGVIIWLLSHATAAEWMAVGIALAIATLIYLTSRLCRRPAFVPAPQ